MLRVSPSSAAASANQPCCWFRRPRVCDYGGATPLQDNMQGGSQGEGGAQRGGLPAVRGAQGRAVPRAAEARPVTHAAQVHRRVRGRHQPADQVSVLLPYHYASTTLLEWLCRFNLSLLAANIWVFYNLLALVRWFSTSRSSQCSAPLPLCFYHSFGMAVRIQSLITCGEFMGNL
jgi:hypothetical protein